MMICLLVSLALILTSWSRRWAEDSDVLCPESFRRSLAQAHRLINWQLGLATFALVTFGLGTLGIPAIPSDCAASELRRTPIVKAVESVSPAVVNIHGHKTLTASEGDDGDAGPRRVNGMGTGVVIDPRGYIVTNHHVIDGVRRIQVTLSDERTYTARKVAHDPKTDLAVIKISPSQPMQLIPIGTSSDLLTGEPVIAVGNAYGYHHTVTRGIISALNRSVQVTETQDYHDLIQTDASINPGNSGGPLLNIDGEMIGINVAVRVGAQGIGFAIPVDKVMQVTAELMNVEDLEGTWHGIQGDTVNGKDARGFVVRNVRQGSPAHAAGIRSGDVIRRIDATDVTYGVDIERALIGHSAGESIDVAVRRDGETERLSMTLALKNSMVASRSTKPSNSQSIANSAERTVDAWEALGMELRPVAPEMLRGINKQYRGGLQVARVRTDGPAAIQGIMSGDILVGMHKWETVSLENLDYILSRSEVLSGQDVKFYIVRGTNTLYGHIPVKLR